MDHVFKKKKKEYSQALMATICGHHVLFKILTLPSIR